MFAVDIRSPGELVIYLKLHGLDADEKATKEMWHDMKEPIKKSLSSMIHYRLENLEDMYNLQIKGVIEWSVLCVEE